MMADVERVGIRPGLASLSQPLHLQQASIVKGQSCSHSNFLTRFEEIAAIATGLDI